MTTLTIKIPETGGALDEIVAFLEDKGVSYLREDADPDPAARNKRQLERYQREPLLTGRGKELEGFRKTFRDDFGL